MTITHELPTTDEPQDWRDAALDALIEVAALAAEDERFQIADDDPIHHIAINIDYAYECYGKWRMGAMWNSLTLAGALAWRWLRIHSDIGELEMVDLLCQRQAKYGHGNILKFKELGLCVRMSDKAARLANQGGNFDDESITDTFMDIVGYTCIALMLRDDTFELELP